MKLLHHIIINLTAYSISRDNICEVPIPALDPTLVLLHRRSTGVRRALHATGTKVTWNGQVEFLGYSPPLRLGSYEFVAVDSAVIRLGVHPLVWKTARGILLQKPGRPPSEYSKTKGYRVISLLGYLGSSRESSSWGYIKML